MAKRLGSAGIPIHRLGHCYNPDVERIPNISRVARKFILQPIRTGNMQHERICVNGLQGSGKSEYCIWWAHEIQKHYTEPSYIIYTNSLDVVFAEIKKMPPETRIVIIILDDMTLHHASYDTQNKGQVDIAKLWYQIRHEAMRVIGRTGIIFTEVNWQRYTAGNTNLRNCELFGFLTPMNDKNDIAKIVDIIGNDGYQCVREEYADRQLSDVRRSRIVIGLPGNPNNPVGWQDYQYIRTADPEWEYPRFLDHDVYFAPPPVKTYSDILKELESDPVYSERVKWFRMHIIEGKKQSAIAAEQGKGRSTVSEGIARIYEILAERGAEA